MKKRVLSLLLAVCLAATMVPAVFAVDGENGRPIPDELPIVYEEDAVALASDEVTADYPGSGTKANPVVRVIDSPEDFQLLIDDCKTYTGTYYDVQLMIDLDLSQFSDPDQWDGYLNYFMGTFDGNGKTISGIPEDCYLFYQIHNATIGNFTLDLKGEAGTLMYYTFRVGKEDGSVEWGEDMLCNINVVSDKTIRLEGNGQANYAPFMFAAGPYFTMQECNNYANINGDTYAAVFSGYYPLPASDYPPNSYFKFIDCENHGDVTLRYAGLFFGNPTGLRADRNITFNEGVKNYGVIRGIDTAHFFSSDAGANDYFTGAGYFSEQEDSLDPKDENGDFIPENNRMRQECTGDCIRKDKHSGALFEREKVSELKVQISEDGKGYQVIVPEGEYSNYKYVVNAYCYVSLFLIQEDENKQEILVPDGTTRITMSETVTAENAYTTSDLKNLKLYNDPTLPQGLPAGCRPQKGIPCLYFCAASENNGYWLSSNDKYHETHRVFINREQEPGSMDWSVYVSVFDGDKLVDTAVLDRQGGNQ